MSKIENITLDKVKNYLKNNGCKVIEIKKEFSDNGLDSLYIYDIKKIRPIEHNKDLRLLNELGKHYVKVNYPLFKKDLEINSLEVIGKIIGLPYNEEKLLRVKPFKKIVKKSLVCSPNKKGQIRVKQVTRRRDIS